MADRKSRRAEHDSVEEPVDRLERETARAARRRMEEAAVAAGDAVSAAVVNLGLRLVKPVRQTARAGGSALSAWLDSLIPDPDDEAYDDEAYDDGD